MKAVVMAGGCGSRLRPLTNHSPKPMMPFIDEPVLTHILHLLKHHQIFEVIITVHHLADQIQDYFGDGSQMEMTIHYVVENKPLGTAGSVKNTQKFLDDETFLVISGDIVTDINLSEVIRYHQEKNALATLALKQVDDARQYGVVITDEDGRIRQYVEKPKHKELSPNMVNTGIYVFEPKILEYLKPGQAYDFSYDLFPLMLCLNKPVFGFVADGYWCDIGTIPSYLKATTDALAGKIEHINPRHQCSGEVRFPQPGKFTPQADFYSFIYELSSKLIEQSTELFPPLSF